MKAGLDMFLQPIIAKTFGNNPMAASLVSSLLDPGMADSGSNPGAAPAGATKRQLYQGFIDAGRPDLAKMVRTKAFDTWVGQESGWDVDAVSPANNQGLANDGLFQIWRGHDYNSQGQVSGLDAYRQAQVVAQHFPHLDPNDIRGYARSIRQGTYKGWG